MDANGIPTPAVPDYRKTALAPLRREARGEHRNRGARSLLRALPSLSIAFAAHVLAQTCASPLVVLEGTTSGTTCGAGDNLPFIGATASPQEDAILGFTASPALAGTLTISTDFDAVVWLLPSCTSGSDPLATVPVSSGTATLPLSGWPAGWVFVAISANPFGSASACGAYSLQAATVVIDAVFADGFDASAGTRATSGPIPTGPPHDVAGGYAT